MTLILRIAETIHSDTQDYSRQLQTIRDNSEKEASLKEEGP